MKSNITNNVYYYFTRNWSRIVCVFIMISISACSSVGPATVARDRFDYVVAISDSYKRQTLLNLVKTRYLDVPVFMDINSVINQYSIEGQLGFELAPSFSDNNLLLGNGKYTDRPTITYSPLTGEKYSRGLLMPLPLGGIFLLLQSGYPVDAILRICAQSINGIENRRSDALSWRNADPRFEKILELLRDLQNSGTLYYRINHVDKKLEVKLGLVSTTNAKILNKIKQLRQLLGLAEKAMEFRVVFGVLPGDHQQIAMVSRSMMQIMIEYAADIEVPQSDIDEGRVMSTVSIKTVNGIRPLPLIKVHHGSNRPEDAHVAVSYRNNWYWISDTDMYSKATFQFLMVLFSLTERETSAGQSPVITVPTY